VCRGQINPGPLELGTAWVVRPEDWVERIHGQINIRHLEEAPIVDAVRFNREAEVTAILSGPYRPDAATLGQALLVASESARLGISRALLDAGAAVNIFTEYAIRVNWMRVMKL
jgi:hypothetical protein